MPKKSTEHIKRAGYAAFRPDEDPENVCPFGWQADLYVWETWLGGWRKAETEYRAKQEGEPTLEDRVAELERQVESLLDFTGYGR